MTAQRFNQVGLIIGQRGTGKTLYVLGSKLSANPKDAPLNIRGLVELAPLNKQKVLVIDTLDHPAYRKIPALKQSDFKKFTSGARRVWLEPDSIRNFVDLINRSPHMNGTMLIFEDAGKYTEKNLPPEFKRLIIDSKQRNIDIIFMYHCFIDTPANIFTKCDFWRLFKTEDGPRVRRNNIRLFEKVEEIYNRVKNHESRFYSEFIDTRTN